MINIQAILVANVAAVLLLLMVLHSSWRMARHGFFDYKAFSLMAGIAILQCVIETVSYLLDGSVFWAIKALGIVLKSLLYINNVVFALTWTAYADYKLFEDTERIKRRSRYLVIPAVFVIICSLVNIFTPVFFSVSQEGVYHRTALYIIPNLIAAFYLMYGVILIYRYRTKVAKFLLMPVVIFMIPIGVSVIVDYAVYGISVKMLGAAIAVTSLYFNMQNEVTYTDSLSELFNRQYMINYMKREITHPEQDRQLAGIMLDIDRFKSINDSYGHLAGDDAIRSVGQILRGCVPEKDIAVRYAGDEFMILKRITGEQEIRDAIVCVRDAIESFNQTQEKPYKIQVSMGYSIYNHEKDNMDSFFSRMDSAMYAEKKAKAEKCIYEERRTDGGAVIDTLKQV